MNQGKKKKKIVWQQYIGFAFMMLVGVICGIVIASYLDKFTAETPSHQKLISFAGLLLGMLNLSRLLMQYQQLALVTVF